MATVNFLVKGKENPATIHLRFKHGRSTYDFTKSTNKLINPKDWNSKSKVPFPRSPQLKNLKKDLRDLANHIIDSFNETNGNSINGEWLQKQIDIFNKVYVADEEQSDLLTDSIQHVIDTANTRENSHGNLGLSKSRINSYKNLLKIIKTYQGRKKYRAQDVDIKFGKTFLDWMINKRHYAEGYAKKKIDDLKTVCSDAEINGVEVNRQLKKVKGGKTTNEQIIYLNPVELQKIGDTEITNKKLQNARKWLLLGCNIGQRGGDLLKLTGKNFCTRNGLDLIELKQQKTGKNITIPVLESTNKILQEGLPYPISIRKFNDHIKEVCELADLSEQIEGGKITMVDEDGKEIPKDEKGKYIQRGEKRKIFKKFPKYELITSHVCRRSFSSNQYNHLPTSLIMQITGHGTEKMFLQYIGKSSYDYAQQIADYYNKQRENS
jgi:hypothetical protein